VSAEKRSEIDSQTLIHAHGGLKVALHLIHPLISFKPIVDSPQNTLLLTPDKKDTEAGYFDPRNFVVQLRITVLPLLRDIWQASWLMSAPLGVSKSVVQVVLELLNTDQEEIKEAEVTAPSMVPQIPMTSRTIGPDENRIRQLTDMGFPRSAAERALIRARNNVNHATELLLAQPFPLPPDPNPPEPAEAPTAVPDEAAVEAAVTAGETAAELSPNSDDAADSVSTILTTSAEQLAESSASSGQVPAADPVKSHGEWLKELHALREPLKDGLGSRILALVDEHPALVFDVQKVFVGPPIPYREEADGLLVEDIKKFSDAALDRQEQPLAVRFRILALVLNDPSSLLAAMPEAEAKSLMAILVGLLLSTPLNVEAGHATVPKWLASHLLVTEALLMMGEEPRSIAVPKEDEPIVKEDIETGPHFQEARLTILDFCLRLLQIPSLPRDELLSSLRLFMLLTRDHSLALEFVKRDGIGALFRLLKESPSTANAPGTHPYIASVLRHIVEDPATLKQIMQQEIKVFLSHPRHRLLDIGTFVRSCSSMALRDPKVFVQATAEVCELSQPPYDLVKNIGLKNTQKPAMENSPTAVEGNATEMQVDTPVPPRSSSESLDSLVHFLVSELIKSVKSESSPEGSTGQSAPPSSSAQPGITDVSTQTDSKDTSSSSPPSIDHAYSCFVMQCLTELLFSYDSCKVAFLSYSPKKRTHQTPGKDKHRTHALQFLISDLLSFGTINPNPPPEAKEQVTLCNWAMSVIVALCVDTTPTDIKDVPSERASVRKFVLDAINRAIKDLPGSETGEARYSRLLALADLCYRLLTVRFNTGTRKLSDDTPTHIAKVMLEKSFVATLTNALAEVDPNFPDIRGVVTGILRPLEYL
jgi:E3 ubiquitin-protein ligase HUWE1